MKKILLVFGTRPEAIKMCPLVKELQKDNDFQTVVCVTGQHKEMLQQVLDVFSVTPDYNMAIMKEKQSLYEITIKILNNMQYILNKENPDLIIVHGDTTTAFASALAGFYKKIPIAHVEAGLRTYKIDSPYPEEFNRQTVDIITKYYFAPTERAKKNLLDEGKDNRKIFVTGNTAIDALKVTVSDRYSHPLLSSLTDKRIIMITAHRRENLGKPMENMFRAIKRVIDEYNDVQAIYPIHMNPQVRTVATKVFGTDQKIQLIEPLDVIDFHNFMNQSYLILTDSGGIQEEAPSLGKPVLVMRDTTERPEGIEAGTLKLVGTKEESIYKSFKELLDNKELYEQMSKASNPYGDGYASKRIVGIIEKQIL